MFVVTPIVVRETYATIAIMAPNPATFRAIQLSRRDGRLDSLRQYMTRSWFRHLTAYCDDDFQAYGLALPGGYNDGLRMLLYKDGGYVRMYRARNKFYGKYVRYGASGKPQERREYRFVAACQHPTLICKYGKIGQLIYKNTY